MKYLTEDKIRHYTKTRNWEKTRNICEKYGERYHIDPSILVSICIIESFFRPLPIRLGEYIIVLLLSMKCVVCRTAIKNYTIGKCQLGLSTILNFYGRNIYQHTKFINIFTFAEVKQLFGVISIRNSIDILSYRLDPIVERGKRIYPNNERSLIRYIGEQYNGRYSYGLLLEDVYQQAKKAMKQ